MSEPPHAHLLEFPLGTNKAASACSWGDGLNPQVQCIALIAASFNGMHQEDRHSKDLDRDKDLEWQWRGGLMDEDHSSAQSNSDGVGLM